MLRMFYNNSIKFNKLKNKTLVCCNFVAFYSPPIYFTKQFNIILITNEIINIILLLCNKWRSFSRLCCDKSWPIYHSKKINHHSYAE